MPIPLVIFHSNCLDGFGSAYAAYVHFDIRQQTRAEYLPAAHGDTAPDVTGRTVYLLDYVYKRATMAILCQQAEQVIVLDHHISAVEDLAGLDNEFANLELHLDMNRSGAMMSWEYFHEDAAPLLLAAVQDRDLWRFEVPGSHDLNAALMSHPFSFDGWHQWASDPVALQELIAEGSAINRYRDQMIAQHRRGAVMGTIGGFRVPIVNCPRAIVSELLGELAKGQPFAAGYTDKGSRRSWSLRSDADGEDVARIAGLFGGGGHQRAAGFMTDIPLADELLKPL